MLLTENELRRLIRKIIFEKSDKEDDKKDDKEVLGEPDQSMENQRDQDDDSDKKDEINTVGAVGAAGTGPGAGNIRGYVGPLGGGDQWMTIGVPGTKKKKKGGVKFN